LSAPTLPLRKVQAADPGKFWMLLHLFYKTNQTISWRRIILLKTKQIFPIFEIRMSDDLLDSGRVCVTNLHALR
jgi:hypothetical protein